MSVRVAKNRFINFSLVAKYRHLWDGVSNIVELGKHLTLAAETAQLMRQTDAVREYGLMLSNLPVKEYQLIGQYYLGWYACCSGIDIPASIFENIFEQSETYKAKSLITLGALAGAQGDLECEMRYHEEALKHSDLATSIRIARAIAIIKSKEGFHKSAIRSLEAVLPALRFAQPQVYYNTLNSLAVELGEVGRVEEASSICKVVLASPYTFAYPEWSETGNNIALKGYKSRSAVPVLHSLEPSNLVKLPVPKPRPQPVRPRQGKVLSYTDWKEKRAKESIAEEFDRMSDKDLAIKIFELAAEDGMTWSKLRRIVDYILKVHSEPF